MSCKVGNSQGFSAAGEGDRFEAVTGVLFLLESPVVRDVLRDWVIATADCFDISLVRRTLLWCHRHLATMVLQSLCDLPAILTAYR